MLETPSREDGTSADAGSKPPTPKGFQDNIESDMEISDLEPEPPRKKIVTHGLDSEEDVVAVDQAGIAADKDNNIANADSDLSDLSDLDDDDLEGIDEDLIVGRDRREIDIDQDAVKRMGVHRRAGGDRAGGQKKKEVSRRSRKSREESADASEGPKEKPSRPERPLTESERRLKALDKKIEKATKAPGRKRKQDDGISTFHDDFVADLRNRMTLAAKEDADDKDAGRPATRKLKMLPEVLSAFRQKELRASIAEGNLLQAVRFWLEPLPDKSLPAYDIQRELFQMLVEMPEIDYELLQPSGLGKILTFYIRDVRPQQHIRFTAQKLYENWSRPILEKSSNYRHRRVEVADVDFTQKRSKPKLSSLKDKPDALAPPQLKTNRTRIPDATLQTYTIAPRSQVTNSNPAAARPIGASAEDSIRRLKARAAGKTGRGSGKAN